MVTVMFFHDVSALPAHNCMQVLHHSHLVYAYSCELTISHVSIVLNYSYVVYYLRQWSYCDWMCLTKIIQV
jgi:hypothetical protein